jgi:hypothetical protein
VSCDDVRAKVVDALVKQRATTDLAVIEHIESCPACRAAGVDYERLWKEMGDLGTRSPAPDARARFRRRLAAARLGSPRPLISRALLGWLGGAAAAALVIAVGGYQLGTRDAGERTRGVQQAAANAEPAFLLLLHEDSAFRRGEPPKPTAALAAEYARWAQGLPGGTYIRAAPFVRHPGVWLGPPHDPVALGDYVDGYFLIHARDMSAAQQIAATCPHLKYGGRIEVHEIDRAIDPGSP